MRSVVHALLLALTACSSSSSSSSSGSGSGSGSATATVTAPPADADAAAPTDAAAATDEDTASATDSASSKILQVELSGRVACARRADGRVRCWGRPAPATTHASASTTPVEVPGVHDAVSIDLTRRGELLVVTRGGELVTGPLAFPTPAPLTAWARVHDAIDVRAVGDGVFVLTRDGDVVTPTDPDGPLLTNVTALVEGNGLTALHRDGQVSWLGTAAPKPATTAITDATQLVDGTCAIRRDGDIACLGSATRLVPWTGPRNILERVRGRGFACDLTTSGVACRGANDGGQLGAGVGPDREQWRSVTLPGKPTTIRAGERSACALLDAGEVACWGGNEAGQLGDGSLIDRPAPVIVRGLTSATPPAVVAEPALPEATTAMDWSGLPDGCARPAAITPPGGDPITIASAYAYRRTGGLSIVLASFRLDLGGYRGETPIARGPQQALELSLRRGTNPRKPQPIDRGRYRERGPRTATMAVHRGDDSAASERADVLVERADDRWICGRVLDPDDATQQQPFAARVVDPR